MVRQENGETVDDEQLRRHGVKDFRKEKDGHGEALLEFGQIEVSLPILYIEYLAMYAEKWDVNISLVLYNFLSVGIEAMKLGITKETAEAYLQRNLALIKSQGY